MNAQGTHSRLFEPIEVAGLHLPNRLVMAPMGTGLPDEDGFVTDRTIAYYEQRAAGGVGTIEVEASLIAEDSYGVGPELRLHDKKFVVGLRRLAETLQSYGTIVGIQLWHPGRQTLLGQPIAPSPIPLSRRTETPHELSPDEIEALIGQYALSAAFCREAGFDFVEIHGAHCYLPCEFLSPLSNQRSDHYGGSLEDRARFPLEIVSAIRAECGEDFPIFYRISGEEGSEGGFEIEEAAKVSRWLADAGVGCISVSAGNWYALHHTIPPMDMPRGHLLPLAEQIRDAVSVPVIAVGRLDDPELAETAIAEDRCDLIALGRGLIADADWPNKLRDGRTTEIRPCIACNACVDLVARAEEARCAVNPEVGREDSWEIVPASERRAVMVVGSGPAGMEAARIARLRGHDVSIWERDDVLGGKLDVASRAPSKGEVLRFRDYQADVLEELGVVAHLNVEVTAQTVESENPDVVVIATGANPLIPPIPGIHGANVIDAQEILLGSEEISEGERVVIVGGSATGCETAEFLATIADQVTIIEMLGTIGQGIELITRRRLLRHLKEAGVQILTNSKVVMIEPDRVRYEQPDGSTTDIEVDRVALAVGWQPRGSELAEELSGRDTIVLGDASRPADFVFAINAGADAGLAV